MSASHESNTNWGILGILLGIVIMWYYSVKIIFHPISFCKNWIIKIFGTLLLIAMHLGGILLILPYIHSGIKSKPPLNLQYIVISICVAYVCVLIAAIVQNNANDRLNSDKQNAN